jgi:hypothetical protein
VAGRERDDQIALSRRRWRSDNDQTAVRHLRERYDGALGPSAAKPAGYVLKCRAGDEGQSRNGGHKA